MNTLGKKFFLILSGIFLSISLQVVAMDLPIVQVPLKQNVCDTVGILRKQLAEKEQYLTTFQIQLGKKLIKNRQEIQGLQSTHQFCKKKWHNRKKEYKEKLRNFDLCLKQKTNEKEEMRKFLVGVANDFYSNLKNYTTAVENCKKYEEEYSQLIWKKNVYKDLFLVTLSSFLIYFLWNKYSQGYFL